MRPQLYIALVMPLLSLSTRAATQAPSQGAETELSESRDGSGTLSEDEMIAAAVAEAEQAAPRYGPSVGVDGMRGLRAPYNRGLGASIAFTARSANAICVGQLGVTGWPSALYDGRDDAPDRLAAFEFFIAGSLYPFAFEPVDFGFYVLLASTEFDTTDAARAALGVTARLPFDEVWSLRYQLGFSLDKNIVNVGLVSTLAIDLAFPWS